MKMAHSRVLILTFALIAGTSLLARQGGQASQEPQFRTGTNVVPIYVTVVDASGRLVTDLRREDFQVFDNGAEQKLVTFANEVQPITVVVMLDRSGSVEDRFTLVEQAANEFVNHLTPDDRARIGSFAERVQIDPETFTSDKEQLREIIRDKLQPIGPTPLWNATNAAITAVSGQAGRRVVLVFTDGHDAPLDSPQNVSFANLRTRAQSEEVMVYGIGLMGECAPVAQAVAPLAGSPAAFFQRRPGSRAGGGQGRTRPPPPPPTRPPGGPGVRLPGRLPLPIPLPGRGLPPKTPTVFEPRTSSNDGCDGARPDPDLRVLTEIGGGGYFELRRIDDLSRTFARIADELHRQYLLAFVATKNDGQLHRLDVRVKRSGVMVRARKGYIASR